jgi:uncharacterized protein (TIGR03067 family)
MLVGTSISAEPPTDETAITGTWAVESVSSNGDEEALFRGARLALKDGKAELVTAGGEKLTGSYKLDPAAKPKAIDLTLKVGDFPTTHKGRYVLDKDALTLYLPSSRDADRPTKLDGKGCDLWRLKRAK